ncbi:hypothetical protein [Streptomyces sp. ISL-94]|uniref:hypothetical protein n=1 Tax=Streptomyces sp. ISL-94 TaxID=2819190 RepID=UPI001BE5C30E|nr:hypothetical protein [Streptomyces sp. ISL-94]MBT2477367.1 hypothetical protein [Streptomyces sp. ISL-94]
MRGRRRATRDALRRGLAGTALLTASAVLVGLIQAAPAGAVEVPPDTEPPYRPISLGEQARLDRCAGGFALHIGGPEMKKTAAKALTGPAAELAKATDLATGMDPLHQARVKDRDSYEGSPVASAERRERWEASNYPYWKSGTGAGIPQYAPQFDKDVVAFTLGPQRDLYNQLGSDGHAVPSTAALDKAKALAAELKGQDLNNDFVTDGMLRDAPNSNYRSPSASDIARYLRLGGYMKQTPAEDSVEFRLEVEALKVAWGSCDSRNPGDYYRVMSPIVVTAHLEWEQEYAAQAKPRADIVDAEVAAAAEVRKSSEAMIEALGQAWLADQILTWQKYWAGQPANASGRPAAAIFTKANQDLAAARTKAADQAKIAATASAAAKTAADKAGAAQSIAWNIADGAKTPRGRGLLFAQQSVQVAKASAAAAEAAAKATLTASNAAKATVADSKTLYALAQTQSHALSTEFRRVAAQEAAAQTKAAAASAAAQAKEAAENATKAQAAQATAEKAQETARLAAQTAKNQRVKAEKEKATAAAARQQAATERGKAQAAEQRALAEKETAARARTTAEGEATAAGSKRAEAELAEHRAYLARFAAEKAERDKEAKASRAAALEAAADARWEPRPREKRGRRRPTPAPPRIPQPARRPERVRTPTPRVPRPSVPAPLPREPREQRSVPRRTRTRRGPRGGIVTPPRRLPTLPRQTPSTPPTPPQQTPPRPIRRPRRRRPPRRRRARKPQPPVPRPLRRPLGQQSPPGTRTPPARQPLRPVIPQPGPLRRPTRRSRWVPPTGKPTRRRPSPSWSARRPRPTPSSRLPPPQLKRTRRTRPRPPRSR